MLLVPSNCFTYRSIISIIDTLTLIPLDISFTSELIEEDIEAFDFILGESNEPVIEGQRSILDLFEDSLQHHDVVECVLDLEEVHTSEEGIGVGDQVVALGKFLRANRTLRESGWSN